MSQAPSNASREIVKIPVFIETEILVVVDKPHGWLTTPARLMDDPRPCLGRELQRQLDRQIYPVNRLDFEVSGLTLWALDPKSHTQAQAWFEKGQIRKLYEAYSRAPKNLHSEWQEWKSKLVRGKKRTFVAAHGKDSLTLARQLSLEGEFCKWELVAVTGRSHQLRFEMSQHGFPILGDCLYGGDQARLENWLALRAVEFNLSAIATQERLGLPEICRATPLILPADLRLAPTPATR